MWKLNDTPKKSSGKNEIKMKIKTYPKTNGNEITI